LTSEQAAKLLNVSRPHINKLLDSNLIPGVERMAGGHRRIRKGAVLRYKEQMKQRQANASLEVGRISTELGLYDDELAGIPEAPKAR
jgi:excisionase family DNA binding protein